MKNIRLTFIFSVLLCFFVSTIFGKQPVKTSGVPASKVSADTIEISGKFINPCRAPQSVKLSAYNIMVSPFEDVSVNSNSEFTYHLIITGPKQVALRTNTTIFEFIVTPQEKVYHIEITCDGQQEIISAANSKENKAFIPFNALSKTFKSDLGKFSGSNLNNKDTFDRLVKLCTHYQDRVSAISKNNPGTFTADVLCSATLLPKSAFTSIQSLRENFLQSRSFSNPQFYFNFLPSFIIVNYFNLLEAGDTSFTWVESTMNTALQDAEAGKLFQQTLYNLLYNLHKERLLVKYILWADRYSANLDPWIKLKLQEAEKSMPGVHVANFQLEDTTGALKKIGETIASSKLTLLIFYSPTCEHCQEQLPKILPTWNKYKNKGLKIYAVGCEAEKFQWRDFIHERSTQEWTNVFEPSGSNAPSVQYFNIHDYPKYILLNQHGIILSRFNNLGIILQEIPKQLENMN